MIAPNTAADTGSGAARDDSAMAHLDYQTAPPQRLNWLGWSALLSAVPLVHYAVSVGIWARYFVGVLCNPYPPPRFVDELLFQAPYCASAMVLFLLSLAAYVLALKKRRAAWRLLIVIAVSTVVLLWIDVHFGRYQISIDIATVEYWENGGRKHEYFTWWWLNDRWLDW